MTLFFPHSPWFSLAQYNNFSSPPLIFLPEPLCLLQVETAFYLMTGTLPWFLSSVARYAGCWREPWSWSQKTAVGAEDLPSEVLLWAESFHLSGPQMDLCKTEWKWRGGWCPHPPSSVTAFVMAWSHECSWHSVSDSSQGDLHHLWSHVLVSPGASTQSHMRLVFSKCSLVGFYDVRFSSCS